MKINVKIPKNRLCAPIDFGAVLTSHCACGVKLSYEEFPFMQFPNKKVVLFDAYSAAHRYAPIEAECGVLAFPFRLGCMTDEGERVAYCGLRFSEEKPVEWKPVIGKEAMGLLAVDEDAAAVALPSGVCCISSEAGYGEYYKHIKGDAHPLDGLIVLDGQTHTEVELYGEKFAVFSAGWGDGPCKCYVGYDASGAVAVLMVDFGMIEYPASDGTLTDVEVDAGEGTYVYDPQKSESENNIAKWTHELGRAHDDVMRMQAYSRRGYAYHLARDYDAALKDYLSAIECCKKIKDNSALHGAWFAFDNAAEILSARSDYDSAIKIMEDALAVNDSFYSSAYVRLIELYRLVKREDKALASARLMLSRRPDDPVAYIKYAECCVAATDYAEAAKAFDTLATEFWLCENLFDEASCLIALGEHEKAIQALERHPAKEQYEQYWYYKAYIDYKEHRYISALENAETSHAIDGEYMPALYLLIDIESVLQEYHAVARYAEEYKKLRKDNEFGYNVCAEAQLVLGNFSECYRNYLKLYELGKQNDKYAALAAIVGSATGEKKRSQSLLRMLKRKRSAYYLGAFYGVYSSKYKDIADGLDKVVNKSRTDSEFLMLLALYLIQRNSLVPATRLLGELGKDKNLAGEVVALQVRLADRLGDKKQFFSFLDYYVKYVMKQKPDKKELKLLAERFMSAPQSRSGWFD